MVAAAQLSLAWDSVADANSAGYRVYARLAGETYGDEPVWSGESSFCTINDLNDNNSYCFIVRASNINDIESADSNEACYQTGSSSATGGVPTKDGDGDGMSDDWEAEVGLDPSQNDADADLDGDGISNIDEHALGSDPKVAADNTPPEIPVGQQPIERQLVDSLTPEFQTDAFQDSDANDGHYKTQWRIIRVFDEFCVFDVKSKYHLTKLRAPKWILEPETEYYWQVRFLDQVGAASQWSSKNTFETAFDVGDEDGNGILDLQEIDQDQDLNGDGIVDSMQPDTIKCVTGAYSNGIIGVGLKGTQGDTLISAMSSDHPQENLRSLNDPVSLAYGLFEYKIELAQPGSAVQVQIFLPSPAQEGMGWYHLDIESSWVDYREYAQFSTDRKSVTLELKDGGYGDIDGIENGVIVDRSGIMLAPQSSGGGDTSPSSFEWGESSACFINTTQRSSEIEQFYLWLAVTGIAMFLLGKIAEVWHEKNPRAKKAQ